jgi:hypothetical protein
VRPRRYNARAVHAPRTRTDTELDMPLAGDLPLDELTPSRLWSAMDPASRLLAAQALYDPAWSDEGGRGQANLSIAAALRFRESSVRQLPLAKRADYLARLVRPSDALAAALLTALHLGRRGALLGSFLDSLGIPQREGVIDEQHVLEPPAPERLARAVTALAERFAFDEVELYLATLLALDSQTWGGLAGTLRDERARRGA